MAHDGCEGRAVSESPVQSLVVVSADQGANSSRVHCMSCPGRVVPGLVGLALVETSVGLGGK